nr:hypothetical protein [Streptomyces sp. gCLA4]
MAAQVAGLVVGDGGVEEAGAGLPVVVAGLGQKKSSGGAVVEYGGCRFGERGPAA